METIKSLEMPDDLFVFYFYNRSVNLFFIATDYRQYSKKYKYYIYLMSITYCLLFMEYII